MSWAGFEMVNLYFGLHGVEIAHVGEPVSWHAHLDLATGAKAAMEMVRAGRTGWPRTRANVWFSGALARPFVIPPMVGIRSERELAALSEARAMDSTGLPSACTVWLSSGQRQQTRLAVAVESSVVDAIQSGAAAAGVKINTLRPWWAGALDLAVADAPELEFFAAQDKDSLTLLAARKDEWVAADGLWPAPAESQIESLIVRKAFAAGLNVAEVVRVQRPATDHGIDGPHRLLGQRIPTFSPPA